MEKMKFETVDGTRRNIDKIAEMFPQVVTEVLGDDGKLKRAVKWDVLKELLSGDYVEGGECYEFTWPGKRAAIAEAAKPIRKTLRPCKAESKNWDTTENLYIEGDNLEVLKLLQESYLGKVKMIYIDPPYNTGNDFVYKDNFTKDRESSEDELGLFDEETDNRTMSGELFHNTESNGRFHSDWCSMIYPRLQVAKDLLSEDGIVFISIDSNEITNLQKICDEIYGATNFISQIVVKNNPRGRQSDRFIATVHEYLLCYAKDINQCIIAGQQLTEKQQAEYCYSDERGKYRLLGLRQRGVASLREDRPDMFFPIYVNTNTLSVSLEPEVGCEEVIPKKSDGREGRWMWGKEKCLADKDRLVAKFISSRSEYDIFVKDYLNRNGIEKTRKIQSIWDDKCINNQNGTQEVKKILCGDIMSFPKSRDYIQMICGMITQKDGYFLDFFSGSATTAHAVMQLNAEDGGNRKFIMVQLPEVCAEDSEAAKAGYKNICEIGKERIRRAGDKILAECAARTNGGGNGDGSGECGGIPDLDIGFRVFKVADSNMKDVYYSASDYSQDMLDSLVSNIKEDRTDLDLLYSCLLEWGVELSLPHTSETIDNVTVHTVNNGDLIACFDANIPESAIRTIAKRQPLRAVFRDSSFSSAPQKINVEEIFKLLSPTTTVKVI